MQRQFQKGLFMELWWNEQTFTFETMNPIWIPSKKLTCNRKHSHVNPGTMKRSKNSIGENLRKPGLGGSMNMTTNAQTIKTDKLDHMKIKTLWKALLRGWKHMLQTTYLTKGSYLKLNSQNSMLKKNNTIRKQAKDMKGQFTEQDIQWQTST